jgi:hypothetical protein
MAMPIPAAIGTAQFGAAAPVAGVACANTGAATNRTIMATITNITFRIGVAPYYELPQGGG